MLYLSLPLTRALTHSRFAYNSCTQAPLQHTSSQASQHTGLHRLPGALKGKAHDSPSSAVPSVQ